ncbi:hypothetical protein GmHk_04G009143 [Glycine max]|nr:hypothetical protein GmHk_04G009143 [Glycine max]
MVTKVHIRYEGIEWESDELERERPRSGPGNFDLVLDALYHLLFLRPSVTVRTLEPLPFLRLLVPASTHLRHRRSRPLRRHEQPRSHAAPLHHARTINGHEAKSWGFKGCQPVAIPLCCSTSRNNCK